MSTVVIATPLRIPAHSDGGDAGSRGKKGAGPIYEVAAARAIFARQHGTYGSHATSKRFPKLVLSWSAGPLSTPAQSAGLDLASEKATHRLLFFPLGYKVHSTVLHRPVCLPDASPPGPASLALRERNPKERCPRLYYRCRSIEFDYARLPSAIAVSSADVRAGSIRTR